MWFIITTLYSALSNKNGLYLYLQELNFYLIKNMAKRRRIIQFNERRLYYNLKEVADHFAVNVSLLRFWEKEFDNINPKKTQGGARQFTREDIRQVELVYNLVKERGMTLEGAKQVLKSNKDDETKRIEALDRLKKIRKELAQLQNEFDTLHELQQYNRKDIE